MIFRLPAHQRTLRQSRALFHEASAIGKSIAPIVSAQPLVRRTFSSFGNLFVRVRELGLPAPCRVRC
jgi:hypothetical protein